MARRTIGSAGIPLALAVATFAAYAGVARLGFVFDDAEYVVNNHHLLGWPSWHSLWWASTAFYSANWHPLTWVSHMLDLRLFGLAPAGHHTTSVVLHVANALLLWRVLQRLTGSAARSGFVAALFALHPLHVESVAWVSERKDVLSTFFGLLALGGYLRYVRLPTPGRYAAVAGCFVLSLMAKPMLVTLPFVFLLLDWWPLGRWRAAAATPAGDCRRHGGPWWLVAEKTPLIILAAGSAALTLAAHARGGAVGTLAAYPLSLRVQNALVALVRYLGKAVWPTDLAALYPYPEQGLPWYTVAGAALALLTATALALLVRRTRPVFAVSWFLYLGTLLPVIGLVQVGSQSLADRYTYVPLLGVFLGLTWGAADLGALRRGGQAALAAAGFVLLAGLGILTRVQVTVWMDDVTLFGHAARVTVGNDVAHLNVGLVLGDRGRLVEARQHLEAALSLRPASARTLVGLGGVLQLSGDLPGAIGHFRRAVHVDPRFPEARLFLGTALLGQGNLREAELQLREALRLKPDLTMAQVNLGKVLAAEAAGQAVPEAAAPR